MMFLHFTKFFAIKHIQNESLNSYFNLIIESISEKKAILMTKIGDRTYIITHNNEMYSYS